jgi:hypothetical protein
MQLYCWERNKIVYQGRTPLPPKETGIQKLWLVHGFRIDKNSVLFLNPVLFLFCRVLR